MGKVYNFFKSAIIFIVRAIYKVVYYIIYSIYFVFKSIFKYFFVGLNLLFGWIFKSKKEKSLMIKKEDKVNIKIDNTINEKELRKQKKIEEKNKIKEEREKERQLKLQEIERIKEEQQIKKQMKIEQEKKIQEQKEKAKQLKLQEKNRIKEEQKIKKQMKLEQEKKIQEAKEKEKQLKLEEIRKVKLQQEKEKLIKQEEIRRKKEREKYRILREKHLKKEQKRLEKEKIQEEKRKIQEEKEQKLKLERLKKESEIRRIQEEKRLKEEKLREEQRLKRILKEREEEKLKQERILKRIEEENKKEQLRIEKKELEEKKREEEKRLYEERNQERIALKLEKEKSKREQKQKREEEKKRLLQQRLIEKKAAILEKNKKREEQIMRESTRREQMRKEQIEALNLRKENEEKIKIARQESKLKTRSERKPLKEKLKIWYDNLDFVKNSRNKAEMQRQTLLVDFDSDDAIRSSEKIMYKYVARNPETKKVEKGIFAAFSKLDVHSYLLAEEYEVYEITPMRKSFGSNFQIKLKKRDLVFFLTQLSTFLKAGITLVEGIKILEKQTEKASYKRLYKSIVYELTMGENFSEALAKQGEGFPRLLINMVKTSELTGDLPQALDEMSEYFEETEKTRKQMVSAMTYPIMIFFFATIVIVVIMIFIIPEFVDIYSDMEADLPSITAIVIDLSHFLQKNIVYLLIGLIIILVFLKFLYSTVKVFKTLVQWLMMHTPVLGKIIIYNEVTMFTKTFGSLLNHNVFITDSIEVLSKVTNNEVYKMLMFDTITNLAKGDSISKAFKSHWAFPVIAYEMLLTGEKTGQLGDMMIKVSSYYQEQHKLSVTQIKTFIEPVMIIFLALVVGTILLSVILPMFSLYSLVG